MSPWFLPTIVSKEGGLGGSPARTTSTKSSLLRAHSAALKRRSKPMVEADFEDMARPHSEPAPWAG
jgi:hypothetical protein